MMVRQTSVTVNVDKTSTKYDEPGRAVSTGQGEPDTGTKLSVTKYDTVTKGELYGRYTHKNDAVYPSVIYPLGLPAAGDLSAEAVSYAYDNLQRPVGLNTSLGGGSYVTDVTYSPTSNLEQLELSTGGQRGQEDLADEQLRAGHRPAQERPGHGRRRRDRGVRRRLHLRRQRQHPLRRRHSERRHEGRAVLRLRRAASADGRVDLVHDAQRRVRHGQHRRGLLVRRVVRDSRRNGPLLDGVRLRLDRQPHQRGAPRPERRRHRDPYVQVR